TPPVCASTPPPSAPTRAASTPACRCWKPSRRGPPSTNGCAPPRFSTRSSMSIARWPISPAPTICAPSSTAATACTSTMPGPPRWRRRSAPCSVARSPGDGGDRLDLDERALDRQAGDEREGDGGRMRGALPGGTEGGEALLQALALLDEQVPLDHVGGLGPGRLEAGPQVDQGLPDLRGE